MGLESLLMNTIAATAIGVPGLNDDAIYSAGGGGDPFTIVKDLPGILDGAFPAVVVLRGAMEVIPGSWERTTLSFEFSVWVPEQEPRGEAYRDLADLDEPIRDAFRNRAKGGLVDPAVQSVLVLGSDAIEGRQWQRGERAPWYLVLPYTVAVKVNRAVTYRPA